MTDNKTLIRELIRLRDALIEIERFARCDHPYRAQICAMLAEDAVQGTELLHQSNSIGS